MTPISLEQWQSNQQMTDSDTEAVPCHVCGELVHPDNWGRHFDDFHLEDPLTDDEQAELATCTEIIQKGLKTFVEVGLALLTVRGNRWHKRRYGYTTFEEYCQARWGLSRRRAYQLMDAAIVVENVKNFSHPPAIESHAAPLASLTPDQQQTVWRVVVETAPDGRVTAAHVQSVVEVFRNALVTGAIDGDGGEQVAVHDLVAAAVTEETYERLQRQRQHLREKRPRRYLMRSMEAALVETGRPDCLALSRIVLDISEGMHPGQRVMVSVWVEEN